ncbi:hypothetical protein ACFL1E_00865 [Candidatus Omnitrophota bacterium]
MMGLEKLTEMERKEIEYFRKSIKNSVIAGVIMLVVGFVLHTTAILTKNAQLSIGTPVLMIMGTVFAVRAMESNKWIKIIDILTKN